MKLHPNLKTRLGAAGVCAAFLTAGSSQLEAALEHPYRTIVVANAFRLREPEPAKVEQAVEVKRSRVDVKLRGVVSLLGKDRPRGFLEVQVAGGSMPKQAMVVAGERFEGIEVIEIDVGHATMKIRNAGEIATLNLAKAEPGPVVSPAWPPQTPLIPRQPPVPPRFPRPGGG